MSYGEELGKLAREINANAKRNRNKRPVVVHKHTKGEWKIDKYTEVIYSVEEKKRICFFTRQGTVSSEQNKHDARLISQAPTLLQIAEMYFDSMQDKGMEDSIPYKVTLETLKKINPK